MSSERRRRIDARAELLRLISVGVLAALLVGMARGVIAQDAPAEPPPAAPAGPAPPPSPLPSGGSRPSVDVSADASVDFPGDI